MIRICCGIWSSISRGRCARASEPQIEQHRLRREIIATLVANSLVNRGLGEFVGELSERTGRTSAAIARAYIIARAAFGLVPLLGQLELLTGQIGAARQSAILGAVRQTAARGTEWFLRNLAGPVDIAATVDRFAAGIADLLGRLDTVLPEAERQALQQAVDHYLAQGMPPDLAGRCAALPYLPWRARWSRWPPRWAATWALRAACTSPSMPACTSRGYVTGSS